MADTNTKENEVGLESRLRVSEKILAKSPTASSGFGAERVAINVGRSPESLAVAAPIEEIISKLDQANVAVVDSLKGHLKPEKRTFYEGLQEGLNGAGVFLRAVNEHKFKYTARALISLSLAAQVLLSCAPIPIVVVPIPDGGPNRPTPSQVAPPATETSTATETATQAPVEQIDISNPETFKFRSWEELVSPAYLAELEQKEKDGLLPSVPEDPAYVKPGFVGLNYEDLTKSENIKYYGYETIFSLSNEKAYFDLDKRPYTLVDIYKTNFKGIDMFFFVIKWENLDGTVGFQGHYVADSDLIRKDVGLDVIVGREGTQYPTGGFFIKNSKVDGCQRSLDQSAKPGQNGSEFCQYYYDHPEVFLQKDVYKNWQSSGNLITKGSLPISPAGSNRITK